MHGFKPIAERDGINPTICDRFNLCIHIDQKSK